jgi:hypothetical protein
MTSLLLCLHPIQNLIHLRNSFPDFISESPQPSFITIRIVSLLKHLLNFVALLKKLVLYHLELIGSAS